MDKLELIYKTLLKEYGKQGWWPLIEYKGNNPTKTGSIHGYHPNNYELPKTRNQIYEVCIGAILTQNCSWQQVEKSLTNLKKLNALNPEKLLKLDDNKLKQAIKPAGYFNQKAKKLRIFTKYFLSLSKTTSQKLVESCSSQANPVVFEHAQNSTQIPIRDWRNSDIKKNQIPTSHELLNLWGIGPETADSMLLYAFKQPYFAIDAYTKRIFSRIGIISHNSKYDEFRKLFMNNLPNKHELFNEYHALIVEHAKRHCRTKPLCEKCPLNKKCSKQIRI